MVKKPQSFQLDRSMAAEPSFNILKKDLVRGKGGMVLPLVVWVF